MKQLKCSVEAKKDAIEKALDLIPELYTSIDKSNDETTISSFEGMEAIEANRLASGWRHSGCVMADILDVLLIYPFGIPYHLYSELHEQTDLVDSCVFAARSFIYRECDKPFDSNKAKKISDLLEMALLEVTEVEKSKDKAARIRDLNKKRRLNK